MIDEPENIIWRWEPEEKKYDKNDPHRHDDVAEEYVIERNAKADSGIILWGKYHGNWVANPNGRPAIVKLLADAGADLELPRHIK